MSDIPNPPAFPLVTAHDTATVDPGMTLRDWFAGQALAAMGTWAPYGEDGYALPASEVRPAKAKLAYKMADAMLAERTKP